MKKRLFIMVWLLVMLVIALDYYVQSDAFSARLRPYILPPLQEILGPGTRIGMIKANAVPLYIEVRDVFIPAEAESDAVHVRKVRVYINPFPLLLNRINLPSITLLEPHINATRGTNGELSLLQMIDRIKTAAGNRQKEGPSRFTVHLGTITVHNGTIAFLDKATETAVSVSGLTMGVRFTVPVNTMRISLQAASVRIDAKSQPALTFGLHGRAEYDHDRLSLSGFELLAPDVKITASGTMSTQPDVAMDLSLKARFGQQALGRFSTLLNKNVKKRQRPLMELAMAVKGRMTEPEVDGTISLYNIPYQAFTLQDASLAFSYRNKMMSLNGKQWRIAKAQNKLVIDSIVAVLDHRTSGFDINKLEIVAGDLVARATGKIDVAKGYNAELSVESGGDSGTLSFLTGVSLKGKAALHGKLTGELFSPVFDGGISAGPLTIRDILFHEVAGSVHFSDTTVSFSRVDIHQLGSRYILDGSIDFRRANIFYAARLNVVRSDVVSVVALFYKPLPLQLSATGEISFIGSSSDFTGNATLNVGPGSAYGESFSKGSITVTLTPERISFPQVVLQKGNGVVQGNGWIGFNGSYAALLTGKGVNLSEVDLLSGIPLSGIFGIDINSSGSFTAPQVKSILTVDDLRYHQASMGTCKAKLTIEGGKLSFESNMVNDKLRLAGIMDLRSPYAWSASADLQSADITPFIISGNNEALSRVKIFTDGKVTLHGRGAAVPLISGSAALQHFSFTIGDYQIENDGDAVVNIEAGKVLFKALNFIGPGSRLAVTGSSQIMKNYDLTFIGKANLTLLRLFYREIEHSDGNAVVNLTVRESWDEPEIAGEMRIENGEIKIKDIPQKFNALNGTIDFNRERIVIESLSGDVGGGGMKLSGWVKLARFIPGEFSTRMAFDNVTVRYPPGLVSTLSGEFFYDGDASAQSLSGDILVKRALYDKRVEWKSMLLETFKGFSQKKKTEIGWIGETQLNIRFHGKDNILIQNNLAKIPIEVDTFIRGTPNQPQLLGRLEARSGVAYFRRNDFKIQHASVDFVDPNQINPVLDIQAETRIREYTIRLAVSGAADRATVTFVSDPPLSETDVLSMLALGKTNAELKGKGAEIGMGEAASFATGQFQDIFERRARSITGLDRFQVDPYLSKDQSVPRVTVGKELIQDKLYFTYSSNVGSTTADTVLRIEYVLDKHFSLVGEQNELGTIGGDVKFRFEFK
jgi:autotransporter translocation and assembly factor TamB